MLPMSPPSRAPLLRHCYLRRPILVFKVYGIAIGGGWIFCYHRHRVLLLAASGVAVLDGRSCCNLERLYCQLQGEVSVDVLEDLQHMNKKIATIYLRFCYICVRCLLRGLRRGLRRA
jgi:hypothetical protein